MKEIARLQNLAKRNSLSKEQVREKSRLIAERLLKLPEFEKAKTVMLYYGVRNEVETRGLIEKALEQGKRVVLPVSDFDSKKITPTELQGLEDLKKAEFGLMEPVEGKVVGVKELDLIVVPGIAFDANGARIGTGKGFYDGLLRKVSTKVPLVGLCFEENLEESLPSESHDVKMDIIITEKQEIRRR